MQILYIAKHGPHDNCDEDAIAFTLEKLGHSVARVQESEAELSFPQGHYDLMLFHKWDGYINCKAAGNTLYPQVFWYFDLVESDDWNLQARSVERREWLERASITADLGFCTDGDYVLKHPEKLVHLMQGADERVVGFGTPDGPPIDILFTGSTIHGGKRISHINELKERYGERFVAFGHHPKERVHGRALANLIARAKIVVAPDGPVTNHYWSNRVYQALGFGAFLLHPWCSELAEQYFSNLHLCYYVDRDHLHEQIEYHLCKPAIRITIQQHGLTRTIAEHLYRHRCEELLKVVKERLL